MALVALTAIVLTGAAVRLTGSGLGCPDWPRCYGHVYPPLQAHALIEFGNRVVGGVVGVVVVLIALRGLAAAPVPPRPGAGCALLAAARRRRRRRCSAA